MKYINGIVYDNNGYEMSKSKLNMIVKSSQEALSKIKMKNTKDEDENDNLTREDVLTKLSNKFKIK